ncbi:hypothetical protein M5K25_026708 [Dendrobium thyrsiflorum]|uniref:Uncharacterized protein n=1 Tax=Dendrobium thyrsiflorum TaxID=117978 RepID=A0ABD0TXW8_DENTH
MSDSPTIHYIRGGEEKLAPRLLQLLLSLGKEKLIAELRYTKLIKIVVGLLKFDKNCCRRDEIREQFNTDHSSLMMELTIENFSLKAELLHGMGLTEVEVSLLETELLCIEEELVTCGNTSLDTSYQNVPRCAYTSIELHERKRWNLSIASFTAHSWTLRHSEVGPL